MNDNVQQRQNEAQHLTGLISNLRKVTTKTGKPMAVFTIGGTPAKCFDLTVDQAAHWADMGKKVSINGQFSSHQGQIEFVAQNIGLAAQGQADAQAFPEIAAANRAPIRESSTILQNLSGCVSDMRAISTRSGRAMITFKIANTPCKALGDLATAIQKAHGKQIEISARKGTFRGLDEYAVEILKSISGTAVNLTDTSKPKSVTANPASHIESIQRQMHEFVTLNESEQKEIAQAIAEPKAGPSETDSRQTFPGFDNGDVVPDDWQITDPEEVKRILSTPLFVSKSEPISAEAIFEGDVQMWMHILAKYSDAELSKKAESPEKILREAATRLLAERTKTKTIREDICESLPAMNEAEPLTQTTKTPQPEPLIEKKPLKKAIIQFWIEIINDCPFRYPEERLRQLSLQSDEEGEAARRIIAQRAAIDEPFEAPEPEFKKK